MNKIAGFIGLFAVFGNAITGFSIAGAAIYVAWWPTLIAVRYWNRWLTDAAPKDAEQAAVR